jgi:hypothetical protein
MWEKVIEVFVGKGLDRLLKERTPRKKLAKAFVELYEAINGCHEAYSGEQDPNEWKFSIDRLSRSVKKLSVVLEIHEPELLEMAKSYRSYELAILLGRSNDPHDETAVDIFQSSQFAGNYDTIMDKLRALSVISSNFRLRIY